ncbi:hypothetical protein B0H13DRAFT_1871960 [Mycena leptocephala]|nr:hypothetical protein B0H13DRAFT_1871960 [Mycena leptocephala]
MQAACISSFSPSHTPENNLDPVLPFQISDRERSRSSLMPPVTSAGQKHHHKVARHEIKQSTENGSKREKRGDEVCRKYSGESVEGSESRSPLPSSFRAAPAAHLSAASHTGDYLAPEIQISTCNRFAGSPLPSMVKSKLHMSLELRKQCPATLGCSGATLSHLLSSYPSAHETEHTEVYPHSGVSVSSVAASQFSNTSVICEDSSSMITNIIPSDCLLSGFTVPPPTLMLPTSMPGGFQRPARSRPASWIYPEPFWGSEPNKNIVSNAVPVLSAGHRLCSLHPRSTCEGVPSPMLSDSNIAHPALPNYVNNVATLFPHRCSEISRISYATAQFPMQLVCFDSSRNSIMDMYAIDSFTLLDTIAPRTSPIFVPRDIYAAWAAHQMFATRFRDSVNHPPRWRTLVPDNNSSLSLILNVAHSESAQSRYLIGRTPVFKLCLGRAAATMLGRTVVQSSILLSATLSLPNPITDLSLLLRHCTSRTNVVASRDHLFTRHCGVPKNSKSGPRAISRADVRGTRKEPARYVDAPFMVQTQYNSESPEYISSVLEEVLLSIGSISNSQLAVVTISRVNITGAIGAVHTLGDTMISMYPEIIRVNSEKAAAETWRRQNCNTLSCVSRQYNLAKMAKDKDGNIHVANPHDDLRRGIESRLPRVDLVSMNSGSVEDECWHHQRHTLFASGTNCKLLSRANYGWVRNGGVIHHPGDYAHKINADCVPIATLVADSVNELSCSFLWSAYLVRYGLSLNNSAGTPTIMLPFHGVSDVSHESGPGKIREKSEDTQKIVAYPTRFCRSKKSDRERCPRQHNLIAYAASYESCDIRDGKICNGHVGYCLDLSRDRLEDISSASCALLIPPLAELYQFQTSSSWSPGVIPVLDALYMIRFVFQAQSDCGNGLIISGNPLHWSTKCCSENNLITLRVTLARSARQLQYDEITGRNLTLKMARSQQSRQGHVCRGHSESAEVPPNLVKKWAFDSAAANKTHQSNKKLAAAGPYINLRIESTLKDEVYSRESSGKYTLSLISQPIGYDGGEEIYVPIDKMPEGIQNLPKMHCTASSRIVGKVPAQSEYCAEYQARELLSAEQYSMCTSKLLCVQDRVARVQHWQRKNFETLEIEASGKAAEKQMQILWRSLDYDQSSEGLYLNYLLVAQKYSPNGSLARLTADGTSKLRHHSLQAPEYGAGQYSKPNSMERDNMRSGHTDDLYGHPAISSSLCCSTSPSPHPPAAQSLPVDLSSSLGVSISHNQRADVSPYSSGSIKGLLLPSLSPDPPPEAAVLCSSSDDPLGTKNIPTDNYSPSRMFPCGPSSCSLPPNSRCANTSAQEATQNQMTFSSPTPAVVLGGTSLQSARLHWTERCSGMPARPYRTLWPPPPLTRLHYGAFRSRLQVLAQIYTEKSRSMREYPEPHASSTPHVFRSTFASSPESTHQAPRHSDFLVQLCLGTRRIPGRHSTPHTLSLSAGSDVYCLFGFPVASAPSCPLPWRGPAHHLSLAPSRGVLLYPRLLRVSLIRCA